MAHNTPRIHNAKSMKVDDTEPLISMLSRHFWEMLTEGNPTMTVAEIQSFLHDNEGMPFDYLFKRVGDSLVIIPQQNPNAVIAAKVNTKKPTIIHSDQISLIF